MGSIYKRGRIWWVGYSRAGKQYTESSRSQKRGDADRLLKQREGAIANGVPVKPARVTADEAMADVLADYTVNGKRSVAHVRRRIDKHLRPYFAGVRLANISTPTIRAYVARRQEQGAMAATINRELAILRRAFNLARQAGTVTFVPHVPMLKENNTRVGFFEAAQLEAVCRHLPSEIADVTRFAYLTGWRRSEILGLEWRQVDFAAGTVTLDPGSTKNGEGRTIYMSDQLRGLLRARGPLRVVDGRAISPLVFHRDGRRISSFQKAWTSACRAAGCPGRLFHDLRRTAARNLIRAGVPERVVMASLGHKTHSMLIRYNVVAPGDLKLAAERLSAQLTAEGSRV